jgi:hypothetical protein
MIPDALVIGLAGVVVGVVLNQGYTTFREWRGRRRSGEIAAMILAFALEDYADKCATTRATFVDYRSSRGASGEPDAGLPILPDFSEKTDWRSLGKKHTADVLGFHGWEMSAATSVQCGNTPTKAPGGRRLPPGLLS